MRFFRYPFIILTVTNISNGELEKPKKFKSPPEMCELPDATYMSYSKIDQPTLYFDDTELFVDDSLRWTLSPKPYLNQQEKRMHLDCTWI